MLSPSVPEFTRPTYSSMRFGLLPADSITLGALMCLGTLALLRGSGNDDVEDPAGHVDLFTDRLAFEMTLDLLVLHGRVEGDLLRRVFGDGHLAPVPAVH